MLARDVGPKAHRRAEWNSAWNTERSVSPPSADLQQQDPLRRQVERDAFCGQGSRVEFGCGPR